ncbi:hypothetical protein [Kribbella shirazensis]|uniref:Uncharacterized protein n=1 Tax=Kribbella shirazensis TaxID=1105143 RepID=A0A7X5VFF5_9ACTN|nr:hypothetical protein [Kribbella shirazensis]NIK60192.1 hypothetical protein [Kribbella shirazensis]
MTGNTAAEGRVTALDHARLLLARAKAQKAGADADLPAELAPLPPDTTHLATVTSFDPDSWTPHPDPSHPDPLHPGSGGIGRSGSGRERAEGRLASVGGRVPSAARVQQALDTAGVDRELPTHPAVRELLAGASLRGGSAYSVRESAALVMTLMAGPSAEGAWCGVVGVPSFGAEAARGLGVELERLVLVPDPGHEWLSVVAALVDALTVVVVRPPSEVTPGEASRLAARLRTRGAMLIAYGSWPGSEARFEIEGNTWTGLDDGEGLLSARRATVAVTGRRAAVRARHDLWLPALDGTVRSADSGRLPTGEEAPARQDEWPEQIGAVG